MNTEQFMKELEYLLQDIQDEEKEEALQYYRDYLDEAGPDREDEVLKEFGSPEKVAAIIRADIQGQLESGGEFTDSGYQDERYREPNYSVAPRFDLPDKKEDTSDKEAGPKTSRALKIALWIVLVIVAAPVVLGVGGGLLGLLSWAAGCLVTAVILSGLLTVCGLIAGIAVFVWGIAQLFIEPIFGLLLLGIGLLLLGIGLLCLALSVLVYGKLIPFLIRAIADFGSRLLHRGRKTV